MRSLRLYFLAFACVIALAALALPQTKVKPGMNIFSIQQDIEIGRDAARQVEQQLPMLKDAEANDYVSGLGMRLARRSDLPNLPWQFKVVNAAEVNAFALPGGFIYINRGLIEAAQTEGQLVAVLGHEISHVTLRHGTNQITKAVIARAPLAIVGGLLGSGLIGQLSQLGIALGANLLFMKYSREAETQADILGTQLMVKAGYDPHEAIRMFEILESLQKSAPSKIEQWFSSHPTPERRMERIQQEINLIRPPSGLTVNTPRYDNVRARIKEMPPPPKTAIRPGDDSQRRRKPQPPSREFRSYNHPHDFYRISYPANWRVASESGFGALFAPEGGIELIGNQEQIVCGAMINLFEPHRRRAMPRSLMLDDATDELIDTLTEGNPHLREASERRRERLSGDEAVSVILSGTPRTGRPEVVWLVTRWYGDRLLYLLFISPQDEFDSYQPAFSEMMRSLRVSE